VRLPEVVRHEPVQEHRGNEDRIELREAVHPDAVHPRQRQMRVGDRDREPLVEQLVGHHEPVVDPRGDEREHRRKRDPEREDREAAAHRRSLGRASPRAARPR
jgi:hypothetical protein